MGPAQGSQHARNYTPLTIRQAIRLLPHHGIVTQQEQGMVKNVLGAAALTYVAGALMAVVQLVRLILLRGSRD